MTNGLHPNVHVSTHPLIQEKLTRARDRRTDREAFRNLLAEIAALMVFEFARNFPTRPVEVETPLERAGGAALAAGITVVPILRAGLGMAEGVLHLIPNARVGHLGIYRDENTLQPVSYFDKLPPDVAESHVVVVDPMLATGGSASHAIRVIKRAGARNILFLCLVACPQGIGRLTSDHPDVLIYTAAVDRQLNERGFILPGLGDAGDRLYGTG